MGGKGKGREQKEMFSISVTQVHGELPGDDTDTARGLHRTLGTGDLIGFEPLTPLDWLVGLPLRLRGGTDRLISLSPRQICPSRLACHGIAVHTRVPAATIFYGLGFSRK